MTARINRLLDEYAIPAGCRLLRVFIGGGPTAVQTKHARTDRCYIYVRLGISDIDDAAPDALAQALFHRLPEITNIVIVDRVINPDPTVRAIASEMAVAVVQEAVDTRDRIDMLRITASLSADEWVDVFRAVSGQGNVAALRIGTPVPRSAFLNVMLMLGPRSIMHTLEMHMDSVDIDETDARVVADILRTNTTLVNLAVPMRITTNVAALVIESALRANSTLMVAEFSAYGLAPQHQYIIRGMIALNRTMRETTANSSLYWLTPEHPNIIRGLIARHQAMPGTPEMDTDS
jgi:hypothetical protein